MTPPTSASAAPSSQGGEGRDRIRDAAIAEFADRGVAATSLKAIAARAGASQGLIVHHFGSKDGLREECDAHVAAVIREHKYDQVRQVGGFDPLAGLRSVKELQPLLRYLARTLGDGQPQVAALVDELIENCLGYCEEAVRSGLMKPTRYARQRATILVLWSMGLLSLHEHVTRNLGVDITSAPTADLGPYLLPAAEMFEEGIFTEGMHAQLQAAFGDLGTEDGS